MTGAEALEAIRGLARAGRIDVVDHAAQRMRQRRVQFGDLRHALENARAAAAQPDERWKVDGPDLDGDDLTVVVVVEDGLIVVTVY